MTPHTYFVQVGASRDGRDAYLIAARSRHLHTILVETAEYLELRRSLGGKAFDVEIAVANATDPKSVCDALSGYRGVIRLVLPGFERYCTSANAVAVMMNANPRTATATPFVPPDKLKQRELVRLHTGNSVLQPDFAPVQYMPSNCWAQHLTYPVVVKPVDGGGSHGVLQARTPSALLKAVEKIRNMRNFGGEKFDRLMVESFINAREGSVQGIMRNGECEILAYCQKTIAIDAVSGTNDMFTFREASHLALPGHRASSVIRDFAKRSLLAVSYLQGPFHVDFRETFEGPVLIEMGFRLSGGGVSDLVREVSGLDWAEAAFSWMIGEPASRSTLEHTTVAAHLTVHSPERVRLAEEMMTKLTSMCVQVEPLHAKPSFHLPVTPALEADFARHLDAGWRIRIISHDESAVKDALAEIKDSSLFQRA